MSEFLTEQLDLILDTQRQRRTQREAQDAEIRKKIADRHAELRRSQGRFSSEVRSILRQTVDRANRHLTARPEHYRFHDVSGLYTGPLHEAEARCNPIAYELHASGKPVDGTLVAELTDTNMVGAYLGSLRPPAREAHENRIDFGWRPVPLERFTSAAACDLLVSYFCAVTMRWPVGSHFPS